MNDTHEIARGVLRFSLIVLGLFGVAFAWWLRRATELFALRVDRGGARFVRGRIPPSLLRELRDVLRGTPGIGEVTAVSDRGHPRVLVKGDFDAGTVQQLRNVVGQYPLARIRAGKRPS